MNVFTSSLNERFFRSFLENAVNLEDVSHNCNKTQLNTWVTLLQHVNTQPEHVSAKDFISSLLENQDNVDQSADYYRAWQTFSDLPEAVLEATSQLSRDRIAIITTILRFLLIMLGGFSHE